MSASVIHGLVAASLMAMCAAHAPQPTPPPAAMAAVEDCTPYDSAALKIEGNTKAGMFW